MKKMMRETRIPIDFDYGFLAGVVHEPAQGYEYAVIMCHGFRGSKDGGGRAVEVAQRAAEAGFAVLRFDFTPQQILSRQVEEVKAVVKYCRANIASRIILFGRSMGGSACLAYAAQNKNVEGLCLWSTPIDLEETFRLSLGQEIYDALASGKEVSIFDEFGTLELGPEFLVDFSRFNFKTLAKEFSGGPVLIVHGTEDEVVPLRQAQTLYSLLNVPKRLEIIDGGDHRFVRCYDRAAAAVLGWLTEQFCRPHTKPFARP